MDIFRARSVLAVEGDRISQAQSGASSNQAVSGSAGMRSRRHPAMSGTMMSPPRFVENPPAAGTALAPIEWVPEIAAQRGISLGMFRRGARMGVQLAEENLSHQVFREGEEVFVGGVAFGRFVHDMFPVALVRILAPSPTRFSTPLLQNG